MTTPILLTGASGTIGRELVKALQALDADFEIASTSGKSVAGLTSRPLDFNDVDALERAFTGVQTLFLLLPLVENKLELAHNAVRAAQRAGVRHIVRSSGAGADAGASFALPRLQGEIDELIVSSGIPYTLIRPSSFMQNFATFYADMVRGGAVYLPQGEGAVSFIYVRDIAAVTAAILVAPFEHADQVYTLTGAEALSVGQATRLIGDASAKNVSYISVSDDDAIASMRASGFSEWSIEQMMSLNHIIAAGYAAGTTDTVQRLLGREARGFAQFASDYRAVWQ